MIASIRSCCDADSVINALGIVILSGLFLFWDLSRAIFVLLALFGLLVLIRKRPALPPGQWLYSLPIFFLFGAYLLILVYHGMPERGMNMLTSRYLLLLLAVPLLSLLFLSSRATLYLWQPFLLASMLLGVLSLVDILHHGKLRAEAEDNAVVFGFVAIAITSVVLAAQRDLRRLRHGNWIYAIALLLGLVAVLLSGSRGSWLAGLVVCFLAAIFYLDRFPLKRRVVAAVFFIVCAAAISLAIPQVQKRIDNLAQMMSPYLEGEQQNRFNSLSYRIETWRAAWQIGVENPLHGVGPGHFRKSLKNYVRQNPEFEGLQSIKHAHNQYLQTFATAGVPGLVALISLLICHGWLFARYLSSRYPEPVRCLALAGLLLIVAYALMSLTAVPFERKKLILLYAFSSASLWSGILVRLNRWRQGDAALTDLEQT